VKEKEISLKFTQPEFAAVMGSLRLAAIVLNDPDFDTKDFLNKNWNKEEQSNILSHTAGIYNKIMAGRSIEDIVGN
jgi:hypothetical protein